MRSNFNLLILFFIFSLHLLVAQKNTLNFQELLPEKYDKAHIIQEKDYNVWGTNILKGKDGKYHAIYSRWPKSRGHHGWVTHSEIAHAVSDKLTGPYIFKNVVLPARGKRYWDGDCTHNPHVLEYKGKYYLYHMGNRGNGYWDKTPTDRMPSIKDDDEWWVNRNNQRIGLAIADDLNGKWKRLDQPLIDIVPGRRMVSTPTVSIRPDRKFLLAYKYVEEKEGRKGGKVIHVTALSKSPTGPFVDTGVPFITHPTASFAIDDHIEWLYNGRYYCLGKDSRGAWSDYPDGSTMLFESDDVGLNWQPATNFLAIKAGEIKWTDGTKTYCQRTADMPKFYMENAVPKALIVAVLPKGSENSFSVVIPLKTPRPQTEALPYTVTENSTKRPLSAAINRSFNNYPSPLAPENELYTQFKYTELKGFDYNNGDGTITRRDPSKVLLENGKYYVWYTKRHTSLPPQGADKSNDTIPSADWDLAEVWYATSQDGFTWEEQGAAVTRPPKPSPGWRACATPDILKWKGKFYLYYQAFTEASGLRGDYCPVAVSYADSPDGPWTPANKVIIPTGKTGEWDQYAIQAPTPLIHNGKVYVYYKAAFNRPGTVWSGIGLAIADDPLGPFEKHLLNPVQNSGHEICFFPFKEGLASLVIRDGNEHFTVQYAKDWVNFEIAAITEMMPIGPNAFIPDAFADNGNGRGITWGISHFRNTPGKNGRMYSTLARFDCDLSLDVHDPEMKKQNNLWEPADFYRWGLSNEQKKRIQQDNKNLTRGANIQSLNGSWQFKAANDMKEKAITTATYANWDTLQVPGNWDTRERYSEYVGKGYYQKSFTLPKHWQGKQIRLKFGAVYEKARVWVNGKLLGTHVGGYKPFEFNISEVVHFDKSNSVVVEADNTYKRGAWWAWGGISRSVELEANENVRLVYQHISAIPDFDKEKVDFTIKYKVENNGTNTITAQIQSEIEGVELDAKKVTIKGGTTAESVLSFERKLSDFDLWHFDSPSLYELSSQLTINGKIVDADEDKFGIRKFEVRGEQFFLNNAPVRMNGLNRIHDHPDYGNTEPDHLIRQDILDIKSLGCNFSRLMHAPLSKNLLDFCDSIGFLIVEEIPVWGDDDPQAFPDNPLTKKWMKEMIERDFNHPSVVAWSVGNELRAPEGSWSEKALTSDQYGYVNSMLDYVAKLDPTRLKTYVTITAYRKGGIDTEPYEKVDFISMNSYGNAVENAQKTHEKFPNKPIFVSEIGLKQIGPAPDGKLSDQLVGYLKELRKFPWITGVSLWSYNDYRSNYRGTPESGFREWGIVDERRNKKAAYYQLKEIYEEWAQDK